MTAARMTGRLQDAIIVVPELYTPETHDGEVLDRLFETLAYAPLADYRAHELNDGSVERFGRHAWNTLEVELWKTEGDETVGVFGHAIYTQMIALLALNIDNPPNETQAARRDQLHQLNLAETGMIRLTLEDGIVMDFEILN